MLQAQDRKVLGFFVGVRAIYVPFGQIAKPSVMALL